MISTYWNGGAIGDLKVVNRVAVTSVVVAVVTAVALTILLLKLPQLNRLVEQFKPKTFWPVYAVTVGTAVTVPLILFALTLRWMTVKKSIFETNEKVIEEWGGVFSGPSNAKPNAKSTSSVDVSVQWGAPFSKTGTSFFYLFVYQQLTLIKIRKRSCSFKLLALASTRQSTS